MEYTAAVVTVSDGCDAGEYEDASGPLVVSMLEAEGWHVIHSAVVPNDFDRIKGELVSCSYLLEVNLVITTGGTGCSRRDETPEATQAVINRLVPGIPEVLRSAILRYSPGAMLCRCTAGLRGKTLIVNLPGKVEYAERALAAVLPALKEGADMLQE